MRPSPFTQLFEAVPIIHELSEKIGTSYKGQYAAISLLVCICGAIYSIVRVAREILAIEKDSTL